MDSPIIVALDYPDMKSALHMVDRLNPNQCKVKVGKELFTAAGPAMIEKLVARDFKVFLDLKFHDIPNTASRAVVAAAKLGVWMINVHASGGSRMMSACRDALESTNTRSTLLVAVTVLTSFEEEDLMGIGIHCPVKEQVARLALLAKNNGLHGVVCSADEASMLKETCGSDFIRVTPGIRLLTSTKDDQRRITTPNQAISNGSNYLVIGRPITQSPHPEKVVDTILAKL